jgi:hypothetical protein
MCYYGKWRKNKLNKTELSEILDDLLHRLRRLEKAKNQVIEEIFDLSVEVEREIEELEKGLSILKEQMLEFEVIFSVLHRRKSRR